MAARMAEGASYRVEGLPGLVVGVYVLARLVPFDVNRSTIRYIDNGTSKERDDHVS